MILIFITEFLSINSIIIDIELLLLLLLNPLFINKLPLVLLLTDNIKIEVNNIAPLLDLTFIYYLLNLMLIIYSVSLVLY